MSTIHKFTGKPNNYSWQGVEGQALKDDGLEFITKHVVIGANEGAPNYIMRYFHVDPNGHSKLERHPQEHEVIILHGKGQAQIGDQVYDVEPYDVVFISGGELHQFKNTGSNPFGFLCIIPK